MADGSESEDNHLSAKSVKRVRFSDEVKRVEIFEESDDSSLSFEIESASIFPTSIEIPDDVGNKDCTDNYSVQENFDVSFVESDSNNNRELLDDTDTQNEAEAQPSSLSNTDSLITTELGAQHCENMQVISVETNESSQESPEMMDLIHETKSLTISPASLAKLTADALVDVKESQLSICQENKKSKDPFIVTKETSTAPLSRKRSLEGVLLQKQSTKLNSCLRKNNLEISSADRLKDAVFNAWNEVKNDTTEIKSSLIHISTTAEKEKNNAKCHQSTSNKAYEMWKRSKVKSKKTKKSNETTLQSSPKSKSTEDLEESKMAFKAWKEKKDEILRCQLAEKQQKEVKEKTDSLITERTRKREAESAFNAWKAHKSFMFKSEKKKRQYLLEKEKEKMIMKIKKNDEAAKVYQDWLKIKLYSESSEIQLYQEKPPWTPPGKANNYI